MKIFTLLLTLYTICFASLHNLTSFEADFVQSIKDDKNKTLVYKGHIIASKPQFAIWSYKEPIEKDVYINNWSVTIIEPEIEQVIIKKIESNFDFFKLIENAKEIEKNIYIAQYKGSIFKIKLVNNLIDSIQYLDEFENNVKILFTKQVENQIIDNNIFQAKYPLDYDVIMD